MHLSSLTLSQKNHNRIAELSKRLLCGQSQSGSVEPFLELKLESHFFFILAFMRIYEPTLKGVFLKPSARNNNDLSGKKKKEVKVKCL